MAQQMSTVTAGTAALWGRKQEEMPEWESCSQTQHSLRRGAGVEGEGGPGHQDRPSIVRHLVSRN